jgi:hypothetical protein
MTARSIDSDLIRAAWLYCSALQALKVPTPLIISATFKRVKNYRIRSRAYNAPTNMIDEYGFSTKPVEVLDWTTLMRPESVAQTLKPLLDEVWNAAGFDHSASYSANGIWKGF